MRFSRAVAGAAASFAAGFGAMNAWWFLTPQTPGVRGLYDYTAATIGDALLVPAFAATMISTHDKLKPVAGERVAGIFGALWGVTSAAVVVWAGLADPNGLSNWTSPTPGYLTVAGWYHSAFMVVMSSVMTSLYVRTIARAWSQPATPGLLPRIASIGLLGAAFAALVNFDNRADAATISPITSAAALGVAFLTFLLPATLLAVRARRAKQAVGATT